MQPLLGLFKCQISHTPSLLSDAALINNCVKCSTPSEIIHCDFPLPWVSVQCLCMSPLLFITADESTLHHKTVKKQRTKHTAKLLQLGQQINKHIMSLEPSTRNPQPKGIFCSECEDVAVSHCHTSELDVFPPSKVISRSDRAASTSSTSFSLLFRWLSEDMIDSLLMWYWGGKKITPVRPIFKYLLST